MKHTHISVYATLFLIGALLFAGAERTQAASPPKATGGVEFTTTDGGEELKCQVEFQAHEAFGDQPAKGWLNYRDAVGDWFRVDIRCVTVYGDHAFFSGQIVSSSRSEQLNQWLLVVVLDGGTPGRNGDQVWGDMYNYDPGCQAGVFPNGPLTVEKGNLVVHPGTD